MFLCGKWQADRLLIPTIGILKPLSRLYGVLPSDPNDTSADEGCPIVYPYATSKIITRNQRQTCFFWLEVWRVKLGRFHSGAFLSQSWKMLPSRINSSSIRLSRTPVPHTLLCPNHLLCLSANLPMVFILKLNRVTLPYGSSPISPC